VTVIRHLGCLKEAYLDHSTRRGPVFYLWTKYDKDTLIGGGDMSLKLNSKLRPLAVDFYFQFQFWHVFLCDLHMHDHTNFQPNDTETGVTVPTDPFIRSSSPFLCSGWSGWSADPETPKMAEPYFRLRFWWLILNWKARSILVTIRLSRLVSEIFACDRQIDSFAVLISVVLGAWNSDVETFSSFFFFILFWAGCVGDMSIW